MQRSIIQRISGLWILIVTAAPLGLGQEWNCIQVLNNGTATLNWQSDATGAESYAINPMLPAPDYTPLPSTDVFLDPGNPISDVSGFNLPLLTATQGFCYTLTSLDAAGSSLAGPSDTLCTIFLELESGLIPGTVDLGWNSPFHFNPPAGFSGTYAVEQLLPDGSWTVIASAPWLMGNSNTSFPVTQCEGLVTFRVTLTEDAGCVHQSNQASIEVSDQIDPPPPQIVAVDVDSLSGQATISWEPSLAPDVAGYIVYICSGSIETVLATIEDPNTLSWTNPLSAAGQNIEYYNVAGFDSCYVGGLPDPGAANPACTPSIYLDVDWTECTDEADLQWSPVVHWPSGVNRYEVWATELTQSGVQGGPELLAEVPGNLNFFEHQGANIGSLYRYRIVAHAEGVNWTQSSNTAENLFSYPGGPQWIRWLEASIVTDSVAVLRVEVDATASEPHDYEIWRNEPFDDDFEYVNSFNFFGGCCAVAGQFHPRPGGPIQILCEGGECVRRQCAGNACG